MSTSLLYHGFGLPTGYEYQNSRYEDGGIIFVVREKRFSLRCSKCNSRSVRLRGSQLRRFKALPIGNKPCWFEFAVPHVECLNCKLVRQVNITLCRWLCTAHQTVQEIGVGFIQTYDHKGSCELPWCELGFCQRHPKELPPSPL